MSFLSKLEGLPDDLKNEFSKVKDEIKLQVQIELTEELSRTLLSRLKTLDPDNDAKYTAALNELD